MRRAEDICFDAGHTPTTLLGALQTCAAAGLRLASPAELALAFQHEGAPEIAEWVDGYYENSGSVLVTQGTLMSEGSDRSLNIGHDDISQPYHYRCVTSRTN
jgi:hypothetical protein